MSDSAKEGFAIEEIQEASFHQKERLICLETWKISKKLYKPQEQQRIKIRIILIFEEREEKRGEMQIKEGAFKH